MQHNEIDEYLQQGKSLTPLNGKRPITKKWTSIDVIEEVIYKHDGNLGWKLGKDDLVIDVDPRNGGQESWEKLKGDLGLELTPTVNTPSGGFHIYLKYDSNQFPVLKKNVDKYAGIDFLFKGSQCVAVGSVIVGKNYTWADDFGLGFEQFTAPAVLMRMLTNAAKIVTIVNNNNDDDDDFGDLGAVIDDVVVKMSKENVLEILAKLDPSMKNKSWVDVGMALHDWDRTDGLAIWEQWSTSGDNYKEDETSVRWRSFKSGAGVSMGTLVYMSQASDIKTTIDIVESFKAKIIAADEVELKLGLAKKIRKSALSISDIEQLVKSYQVRLKTLTNVKFPIAELRKMLTSIAREGDTFDAELEKPEWCIPMIYVNSHRSYVNTENFNFLKSEAFNNFAGKYIPLGATGTKQSATKFVADNGFVENVDGLAYMPMENELICSKDGRKLLNTFRHSTLPSAATEHTQAGLDAIDRITKHIELLCNTPAAGAILIDWMASQIQFAGKKILWAPVIQSVQGVGKSFLGEVLKACLGTVNVGVVSPQVVTSPFNGWATGVVVNVLEELKVAGHNRHEVANALKPLITDPDISINDKGISVYNTPNTTNYLVLTNHRDALPLEVSDRRWWIIFTQIKSLAHLGELVGMSHVKYFDALWDGLREHPREIRKWLEDHKISDEFLAMKTAPSTIYKDVMVQDEHGAHEFEDELMELIEQGGPLFGSECVCSADFFEAATFEIEGFEDVKSRNRNSIMKRLGYFQLPNKIKLAGSPKRVWVKTLMDNEEIRKYFEENAKVTV